MTKNSRRIVLRRSSALKRYLNVAMLLVASILALSSVKSAAAEEYKSAGGLTVYLGVVPAEIVKGPRPQLAERPMHGGTPRGSHEYHIVVAVYDSVSNTRISDAIVTSKVSGLGLSGPQKTLEPMKIADTTTYGAFFNLAPDLYTIRLTVQRPGSQAAVLDFKYDHRRR